jgi:hypothetical protein
MCGPSTTRASFSNGSPTRWWISCLSYRPHPRNVDRARAAAEVIVAEVPPWVERQAFELASRHQHMTESESQEEAAHEREAEIERNRRRPPRKALYPC